MRRWIFAILLLSGCAVPKREFVREGAVSQAPAPVVPRMMLFYVPQSEESAAVWLKWFEIYPDLRLTLAVSPRFALIAKDKTLRTKIDTLVKAGRLELALQIPNAPILPLLLENPPYGYSDDVVQLIAQSKAGFYKAWGVLPRGLVLPFGAASPRLVSLLERSGFAWVAGALGVDPVEGPYQVGSLLLWDAAPAKPPRGLMMKVWDERQAKDRPLAAWMTEQKKLKVPCVLPSDPGTPTAALEKTAIRGKTWDGSDFSLWVGDPAKNAEWNALRRTREALEKYKNSGQAVMSRLDAAFSEIYSVQNSNFFAAAGNAALSPALVEDRAHEFQASLTAIYRMIGQPVPDDLFSTREQLPVAIKSTSTTVEAVPLADSGEQLLVRESVGDSLMPGGDDIVALLVQSSSDTLRWVVTLATASASPTVDIYVDLNGQPNVGTTAFLTGRPLAAAPKDAWEYAIAIGGPTATLHRTQGAGQYGILDTFPVRQNGASLEIVMHPSPIRGRISRWGYQVLAGSGVLSDFIDPPEATQKDIMDEYAAGNRHDLPFVRIKRN